MPKNRSYSIDPGQAANVYEALCRAAVNSALDPELLRAAVTDPYVAEAMMRAAATAAATPFSERHGSR